MIFRHLLNMRSHPTWVRGLKHVDLFSIKTHKKSHPTWVRGLKHAKIVMIIGNHSRTLRGCVD